MKFGKIRYNEVNLCSWLNVNAPNATERKKGTFSFSPNFTNEYKLRRHSLVIVVVLESS